MTILALFLQRYCNRIVFFFMVYLSIDYGSLFKVFKINSILKYSEKYERTHLIFLDNHFFFFIEN